MYDPELYRDKDEVAEWRDRDPIRLLVQRLRSDGRLDQSGLDAIEQKVRQEIDDAVEFGLQSELEPVEHLLHHVYAEETTS
jgi:pyruvate dehydrogenase E1 component alpha subunit